MSDYRRNFALALSNAAMRRRGDSRQGATQHSSQRIGSAGRRRKAVRSYEKGKSKLGANVKCKHCNGSGSVLSHLNPYDGHKIGAGMGMHRCNYCGGSGKIYGHYATPGAAAAPREKRNGSSGSSVSSAHCSAASFSHGEWIGSLALSLDSSPREWRPGS